jgi:hypothetical protein
MAGAPCGGCPRTSAAPPSRIDQDKHWMSDVVAGAALGYIVGRTVVRVNGRPLESGGSQVTLSVSPIVARHARGLQMSVVF